MANLPRANTKHFDATSEKRLSEVRRAGVAMESAIERALPTQLKHLAHARQLYLELMNVITIGVALDQKARERN